ncbi:MAG: ATP-binding protein [Anaerolineae bacterium]|nr:ATP-binding protein [Anaerolineae bacterium]
MKSVEEIAKQIQNAIQRVNTDTSSSIDEDDGPALGDPDCTICHGSGYVRLTVPVGHPHFGKLFPCTCRLSELQAKRTETLRLMSNITELDRYTFDTFISKGHGISPERQRNLQMAYDIAFAYAERPEGWLVLIGGYGCGKTHLAAAIANTVVRQGMTPLFVTVPDLLDHLRATYAPSSLEGYSDRFEQVRTAPLLILDDLGTENTTSWALEKLFQLLNYRYLVRLPTVITTNHELERLDPRLRSRLADPELVEIVTILAPDFRQAGTEQDASNLNTLSLYSGMRLDNFDIRRNDLDRTDSDNLKRALEKAKHYAAKPSGWLVFTGTFGVGKTHLAAAIANAHCENGGTALFIVVPDLLDHLRSTFNPQSSIPYDRRFDEVRRAPLLVLDDLGTESATAWAKEKLFQLLNHRYVAHMPTVITTALAIEELDPKIQIRLLDSRHCDIFAFRAPPYMGGGAEPQPPVTRSPSRRRR